MHLRQVVTFQMLMAVDEKRKEVKALLAEQQSAQAGGRMNMYSIYLIWCFRCAFVVIYIGMEKMHIHTYTCTSNHEQITSYSVLLIHSCKCRVW